MKNEIILNNIIILELKTDMVHDEYVIFSFRETIRFYYYIQPYNTIQTTIINCDNSVDI